MNLFKFDISFLCHRKINFKLSGSLLKESHEKQAGKDNTLSLMKKLKENE